MSRFRALAIPFLIGSMLLPAPAMAGAFMEISGQLIVDAGRSGPAVMNVDVVYRLEGGVPVQQAGYLEVTCPDADFGVAALIGPGMSLPLEWEIVKGPKRNFGHRAKGGEARLSIPEEGWLIACGDGEERRLYGRFVAGSGQLETELVFRGDRGRFWSRLGIKKGGMPRPPHRVRLRLAWSPEDLLPSAGSPTAVLSAAVGG